jgi:predicted ATP-grasp superfamily ATP-dependent carboligase
MVDKRSFSELLTRQRVPHPQTRALCSVADLHALPPEAFEAAILKPISSVEFARKFGIKGHFVQSREKAIALGAQLEFPILLQEFVPGPADEGYFLEGFIDHAGNLRALLARQRLRMHPAILGNSSLTVSVPLKSLEPAIETFLPMLRSVQYRGMFSAEFKRDVRDGQFKLLEVNARAWWYVGFAAECGIDLCEMTYRDALGLPVEAAEKYSVGRRCFFFTNDFHAWRKARNPRERSIRSLVKPWIGAQEALFRWNDPLPAIYHLGQQLFHALKPGVHASPPKRRAQSETRGNRQRSVAADCDAKDMRAAQ